MATWYCVVGASINDVEVLRETEKSLFIRDGFTGSSYRVSKSCSSAEYFKTWDEAVKQLKLNIKTRIDRAMIQLIQAKELKKRVFEQYNIKE